MNGRPHMLYGRPIKSFSQLLRARSRPQLMTKTISRNGRPHKLVGRPIKSFSAQFGTNCRPQLEGKLDINFGSSNGRPLMKNCRPQLEGNLDIKCGSSNGRPLMKNCRPLTRLLPTLSQNLDGDQISLLCLGNCSGERATAHEDRSTDQLDDQDMLSTAHQERSTARSYT